MTKKYNDAAPPSIVDSALTDAQRDQMEIIVRCDPTFLLNHIEEDTAYDSKVIGLVFDLAKERARAILQAAKDKP